MTRRRGDKDTSTGKSSDRQNTIQTSTQSEICIFEGQHIQPNSWVIDSADKLGINDISEIINIKFSIRMEVHLLTTLESLTLSRMMHI